MMDPSEPQGVHDDGCPYCRVLQPGVVPCPRCGGRAQLHPAQMLDEAGVAAAVAKAAARYDGTRERLDELLRVLFVHRPSSLRALEALAEPSLERLRRDDARIDLAGD